MKEGITGVKEEKYEKRVREKMTIVGLLKRANTKKFGDLMTSIRDEFAFDIDVYPKTLNSAYALV